jgi:hypothetical protein
VSDTAPEPDPEEGPRLRPPEDVPPVPAEQLVDGRPRDRRHPSTLGGVFYLVVLAVTVSGLVVVVVGDWRTGIRWIAAGLLLGAGSRVLLPVDDAGMLAVRHKWVDAALLTGLAGALFFLAGSIPDQPLP